MLQVSVNLLQSAAIITKWGNYYKVQQLLQSEALQMSYMSSNVNEVIRAVLNSLFFSYEEILHTQKKSTKSINRTKSINSKQATFT